MRKTLAGLREGARGVSEEEIGEVVDKEVKAVRPEMKLGKKAA